MIVQIFLTAALITGYEYQNTISWEVSFNDNAATGTKVFHWPRRQQTLGKFAEKFRLSATNFLQYLSAEIDSCGKHLSGTNMSPPLVWNFLRNCVKRKILRAKVLTWKICFSTKISLIKPPMSENLHQKLRGLTISLLTIFLKSRENISKCTTRLFQLLKDTKHTQTTVYKVQRTEVIEEKQK